MELEKMSVEELRREVIVTIQENYHSDGILQSFDELARRLKEAEQERKGMSDLAFARLQTLEKRTEELLELHRSVKEAEATILKQEGRMAVMVEALDHIKNRCNENANDGPEYVLSFISGIAYVAEQALSQAPEQVKKLLVVVEEAKNESGEHQIQFDGEPKPDSCECPLCKAVHALK